MGVDGFKTWMLSFAYSRACLALKSTSTVATSLAKLTFYVSLKFLWIQVRDGAKISVKEGHFKWL